MNPKQKLAAIQKSLQELQAKVTAEGRDFTDTEMADIEAKAAEAAELKGKIERASKSAALFARVAGTVVEENTDGSDVVTGRKGWAKKAVDDLRAVNKSYGNTNMKAFVTAGVGTPSLLSEVREINSTPRVILDLIPIIDGTHRGGNHDDDDELVGVGNAGRSFDHIVQTLRTNNAAAVPDLADKPTSIFAFDEKTDYYRTYANRTEWLPQRYLADYEGLITIVQAQLAENALDAMERDVLSGDGTDDKFTGILNTSGIQLQTYATDVITTLSSAKYKLLSQGRELTGWAMNPNDLQALELLRENGATGAFLFKSRAEIEGFLGAPVFATPGLPVKTAVAADWTAASLLPVGDDRVVLDASRHAEDNTFRLLFEGRYGLLIERPFDFVKVELA